MGLCSNSQSLVVSQQLRVCGARNDAGSAVHRLGKNLATCLAAGWGEFCPKINLTTVQIGAQHRSNQALVHSGHNWPRVVAEER